LSQRQKEVLAYVVGSLTKVVARGFGSR